MAAVDSALTGSPGLAGGWLTVAQEDTVVGYPAQETWPGPATEDHSWAGPADPGRSGPPDGTAPPVPAAGTVPQPDLGGGTIADEVGLYGNSGPMAPFDSSAGVPFAPSGPVAATHGFGTGGTERKEHVPVPRSPGWWRRGSTGQTWNRQAQVTDTAGWDQSAVNDRRNLDQYQGQNANGYDPFTVPYSERPVHANFAATSYPVEAGGGVYGVAGVPSLDYAGGQGDFAYTTPPDPSVTLVASGAGSAGPAPGPDLGMEYLTNG